MPPRYAYWTILIDDKPTAFRARDKAELLPTLQQLKRTNPNALMKWFARGKLWDSPEQAQWASKHLPKPSERRGRDWRPGNKHRDERARFEPRSDRSAQDPRSSSPSKFENRPFARRPTERPRRPEDRPRWGGKPTASRPWSGKPTGSKPWGGKVAGGKPWAGKPTGGKPWSGKPSGRKPAGPTGRPTGGKPAAMKFRKPWRKDERYAKGEERKRRDDAVEKASTEPIAKPKPPDQG